MRSSILRALPMTTMLFGCASDIAAPTIDYCRIFEPILWHPADTPETVRQITRENAKYSCVCDHDCPAGQATLPRSLGDDQSEAGAGAAGQD